MGGLALPEPTTVTIAQAQELADRVERWAAQSTDLTDLDEARAKVGAIEAYLRRRHEQGTVDVARADRRIEVRIGVVLGPAKPGPPSESSPAGEDSISRHIRCTCRLMAKHADRPQVIDVIERGASQKKVLDTISAIRKEEKQTTTTENHTNGKRDRSRAAVAGRRRQLRDMAANGHTGPQIAAALGITELGMRRIAKEESIELLADKVMGNHYRHDSNRIVATMVTGLEGYLIGLELVDIALLDPDQIDGWVSSLKNSMQSLNRFTKELTQP